MLNREGDKMPPCKTPFSILIDLSKVEGVVQAERYNCLIVLTIMLE